jgi:AAA family ATP:ADP antiporter
MDDTVPMRVRRQLPRVLKNIPHQWSVEVLLTSIGDEDVLLRTAALKALNRLRATSPNLKFETKFITAQILIEALHYFELNAALEPFRGGRDARRSAFSLLARTIEGRLRNTLDRLFRLLGLRYPAKEIYAAYQAVSRPRSEDAAAGVEFLDGILEPDLKRILLPLLEAPEYVLDQGRWLFGIESPTLEATIRDLLRSSDPWLRACALAVVAELKLRSLAPDVAHAAAEADERVSEVARLASTTLAAA